MGHGLQCSEAVSLSSYHNFLLGFASMKSAPSLSVCYFGAYKLSYPRNLFYRKALRQLGLTVIECRVPARYPTLQRIIFLWIEFWRGAYRADVMIVAEFSHTVVSLAWLLARLRRMPLIFDPGLSFYDWYVLLTKEVSPHSPRGIYLWAMEWLAYHLPDCVVWFTPVDMEFFASLFSIPRENTEWLPPGIDTTLFYPTPLPSQEMPFIVHWDGNMAPMHGVEVIIRAAKLLERETSIRFEIFGDGLVFNEIKQLVETLQLTNVQLYGFVSVEDLRASVQRAHVCLGVFRNDDKLRRSLYTKEMQAMIAGRPLITGYGEAKDRLFKNGEDLIMIPPEDPQSLVEAILALRANPGRLKMLAENGAKVVGRLCAPESAGMKLHDLVEQTYIRYHRHHVGHKRNQSL